MLAACCEHREGGRRDGQGCLMGEKVVNCGSDAYGFRSFGWQVLCASYRDLLFSPVGEGFSRCSEEKYDGGGEKFGAGG